MAIAELKKIKFRIRGLAPLIVHNPQLSDPLNQWAIKIAEVSKKRVKTHADHEEMSRLEFFGGLYVTNGRPVVPGGNIEKMMRDAAAKTKKGKDVLAGLIVPDDAPILYDGPTDPEKMWKSGKFTLRSSVGIQRSRVMRTRPHFPEWALEFEVLYAPDLLNEKQVRDYVDLAGRIIGLCEWRPKFGRFEVEG